MKPVLWIIVSLVLSPTLALAQNCPQVDWNKFNAQFGDTKALLTILPVKAVDGTACEGYSQAMKTIEDHTKDLKGKVDAGDPDALTLVLRLRSYADGGLSEDLDEIASTQVRKNPRLFLQGIRQATDSDSYCPSVAYLGFDFVDDFKRQRQELQARSKAISSVKDQGLRKVRAACLKALKKI